MRMLTALSALWLLFPPGGAGPERTASFDARAALGYVGDLAADAMLGRKSGQPGGVLAEEYLASRLREWGIEPGGVDGTFFQPFTFPHSNIGPGVRMEIISGRGKRNFDYEEGWRVWPYSGSTHVTTEVVFVGYGIHAPGKDY
ncbi:MAG: hypothetical protein FJY81_07210, partial [Candidatus Aminicenantes bacterium]|nr:hypothetical protein [Candidatus Aminicenantes bacterium]